MSTTETKVRHTWAAQHTAGHETHGQTAIYDEATGKDIAIVYDGEAHTELIVRAVNSHADMLEALERSKDILTDIHQIYGEQMEGTGSEGMIREHVELLTALVAKAKGGA